MKRHFVVLLPAVLLLTGCGWRSAGGGKPGKGLGGAVAACEKRADRVLEEFEDPVKRATRGNVDRQKAFEKCMRDKGYQRDNPGEAFRRFFCSLNFTKDSESCGK